MKLSDVLQIVSLGAVAVALFLNYRQARETGRQANEATRQVQLSMSLIRQESYRQLPTYGANFNTVLFAGNPDLLAWFLATRGIPVGPHEQNLRHMFMFVRMDAHESIFMSHKWSTLEESAWTAWRNAIETDVKTAEFSAVWRAVSSHYISDFSQFVDALVAEANFSTESPAHDQ